MSEKQLISRILAIEREQKKRSVSGRLKEYNTGGKVHEKQMAFHRCLKRNRWVFGGNRSGKTECGAVEAVWAARGIHPYRKNRKNSEGWVVSLSYEVQRDVAQAKVLSYLKPEWIADVVMLQGRKGAPEQGIIDYLLIRNVFGGLSRITFKSCDQGREKFQGASLDWVWFDEEPPYDVYEECRMRVLDRKGDIWGTMTPLKGLTWVYEKIFLNSGSDPEVWHIHMEWADNPWLDKEEIEALSGALDKDSLESRRFGRFAEAEGAVYPEFDQNVHVIPPFDIPAQWQDCVSIDPGLNNPLACLFFAVDWDGNVYVTAEWYAKGRDIDYHARHILDLADKLNWHRDGAGRLSGYIDSAANQRTLASEKNVTELFYERGLSLSPKVCKDVFTGIARVKSYLLTGRLKIFSTCVNLIREFKSYWWSEGDNPVKKDDHALDALRYYIMTRPEPPRLPARRRTMIELDKERLVKLNHTRGRRA